MQERYRPIACKLYAELEELALHATTCRLAYRDAVGRPTVLRSRIRDIYTRRGEEFICLADGREIRLDALMRVNDLRFRP